MPRPSDWRRTMRLAKRSMPMSSSSIFSISAWKEPTPGATIFAYEATIAALERKVGQLTMELDLFKETPRLRLVSDSKVVGYAISRNIDTTLALQEAGLRGSMSF